MRERKSDPLLAVVDLGSNSFRLEIGRGEGGQIYQLDTWRETLRIGAGLDSDGRLKPAAIDAALACLARFRERLSGLHPSAVLVVATNTFRVARNAREFQARAERAIGFPIDVISGHEEGRLTFLGVAHELPWSSEPRLVIDIGGGSTEFIIGRGFEPERLESLTIGCVGMTQRFFADGDVTSEAVDAAETVARAEIEAIGVEPVGPRAIQDGELVGIALPIVDGVTRVPVHLFRDAKPVPVYNGRLVDLVFKLDAQPLAAAQA